MSYRPWLLLLSLMIVSALPLGSQAAAGELLTRWKAQLRSPPGQAVAEYPGAGPAAPAATSQRAAPYYPWCDTALGVPAYRWGYFGAKEHKQCVGPFSGYYQDYLQYGWRRND
jgi:hypothetical protein